MRILRDLVLVSMLQDADKVYAPDGAIAFDWPETEHSEPCVGMVKEVGPEVTTVVPGDCVIFHPYAGYHSVENYLWLPERDIVGYINGEELLPPPNSVVIHPDWSDIDRTRSGLIILPREHHPFEPRTRGIIVEVGKAVVGLHIGMVVIIPPGLHGFEVGFKNRVLYIIPADEILATLEE